MFYAHLAHFQPNPWQPRQTIDPTALRELADNILALKATRPETRGLLQLPAARLVSLDGDPLDPELVYHTWYPDDHATGRRNVPGDDLTAWLEATGYGGLQIAWGHRRIEALRLLAQTDPTYELIPFELSHFSNEEMFQIALSENVARADLNPIEIAQSMLRYRDEFNKSSKEIGTLFGLSDSAVRNLIRLLDLPEAPRKALAAGTMSQGTARALLNFYTLPEKLQNARFYAKGLYWTREGLIEHACSGAIAKDIETLIGELLRSEGQKFDNARWKATDTFEGKNIHHPDCHTCPARVKNGTQYYCTVPACFRAKNNQWEHLYLEQASRAVDLPIFEGEQDRTTTFEWSSRTPILNDAYARRCPNLCIAFNSHAMQSESKHYEKVTVPGFPGAEMICKKMNQHCTCLQAHETGVKMGTLKENGEPVEHKPLILGTPDTPYTEPAPVVTTEADLKAVRQEINAQKTARREQSKAIRLEAERQLLNTINLFNLKAWKLIAKKIRYDCGRDAKTWDELTAAIASQLIADEFDYLNLEELEKNQRRAEELYQKLGLKTAPAPVSTETPNPPARIDASQNGQIIATYASLADVDQKLLVPGVSLIAVNESPNDDGLVLETCIHEWTADAQNNIYCEHCGETFDNVVSNHS